LNILENAKKQFDSQNQQSIEVPEWGDDNGPAIIYWDRVTLADRNVSIEKAGGANLIFYAHLIVRKAKDKNNNLLFKPANAVDFIYDIDPEITLRIGQTMLGTANVDNMEKK